MAAPTDNTPEQPLEGVDRTQHLGQRATQRVQIELDMVGVAVHLVHARGEAVAIDLVAVLQARLHDPVANESERFTDRSARIDRQLSESANTGPMLAV